MTLAACAIVWLLSATLGTAVNPFVDEDWTTGFIDLEFHGNSLFYYLFRAREAEKRAKSLTLWLQGGPGYSNSMSVFSECGPYIVNNKTGKIERNPFAWNNLTDTLFVDQPAPTNFSLSHDPNKICRNQTCVARDLYTFLLKFFELYPEYRGRPLYIAGVSYGGHYVPALSSYIVQSGNPNFNLQGAAIGNGLMDEYSQLWSYPYLLYLKGLIGLLQFLYYETLTLLCNVAYTTGLNSVDILCTQSMFWMFRRLNLTRDMYDLNEKPTVYDVYEEAVYPYLNRADVQAVLGVSGHFYPQSDEVYEIMKSDFSLSLLPHIATLLEQHIKVFIYFGDLDYICNMYGGETAINRIPWSGREEYLKAEYQDWKLNGVVMARRKHYQSLHTIIVQSHALLLIPR